MTPRIKLISTDFDGTIFAEFENPPVPARLQQQIARLQASGAKWVINTGRDMSSLMETLGRARLPIEPDYLVLVEREIHLLRDSQYVGLEEWNHRCSRAHETLFGRVRRDLPELIHWIQQRFHCHIYADPFSPFCLIAGNNDDADRINAYLDEYCRTVPDLALVRNDVYARFSHGDFNKGTALTEVARRLQVEKAHVFAVGDHLNDLPMLSRDHADLLAAPANAIPRVKDQVRAQGGYVSERSLGEGVADALEYFLAGD